MGVSDHIVGTLTIRVLSRGASPSSGGALTAISG